MATKAPRNFGVELESLAETWWAFFIAALPRRWQAHIGPGRWHVAAGDAPAPPGTRPVALALPDNEILLQEIELPLTTRLDLAKLMKFEAMRQIPLPLDQARLDFRILSRDSVAGRMRVELAITRSAVAEAARQAAAAQGVVAEAVAVASEHGPWLARRLLPRGWRDIFWSRRRQRQYGQIFVPILLGLAWVLAAQNWAARLAANRDAAVVVARDQAMGIAPLRQQLSVLNGKLAYIASSRGHPSAAAITAEVARLLPDDAWLQELDIEDQAVHLRGTALNATGLLKIFSASPMFGNVQFEAPLTQAMGTAGDQFDIAMTRN